VHRLSVELGKRVNYSFCHFTLRAPLPPCLLRHKFLTRDFLGEKENRGELFRTKLYWDLKVYLNHRGTRVMQELFTFFQNKTLSSRKD
jgi:hypothetical protein